MLPIRKHLPSEMLLRAVSLGIFVILLLIPFHGLISTVLGNFTGAVELSKAWKELIIFGMSLAVLVDMTRHRKKMRMFWKNPLHILITAYGLLHLVLATVLQVSFEPGLVAVLLNLRFLALFLVGRWLALRYSKQQLYRAFALVTMLSMATLSIFGFLQATILPADFLTNFGYGSDTIPAFYTLDNDNDLIRIASFTRGPNVFAAMLAIYSAYFVHQVFSWFKQGQSARTIANYSKLGLFSLPLVVSVFFTYSRSGWLAIAAAVSIMVLFELPSLWRKRAVIAGGILAAALTSFVIVSTDSSAFLRTLVLHDNPDTGKIDSTNKHFEANRRAFSNVVDKPLGSGPGTAGPASHYADGAPRLAENYYLQIAQEVGVIGLAGFVAIIGLVASQLWQARKQAWSKILLASLVGISIAAMFAHSWADDEISLLWWGLAGILLPSLATKSNS